MGRTTRRLALALLLGGLPGTALAQSTSSWIGLWAFYTLPPTVGALGCDVGIAVGLSNDHTARRGFSITGLAFSGADILLSATVLGMGLNGGPREIPGLAASTLALGVGSAVLAFYAVFHPPPEPEERPPPRKVPPANPNPAPTPEVAPTEPSAPQLRWQLVPFTASERGTTFGGLAVAGVF